MRLRAHLFGGPRERELQTARPPMERPSLSEDARLVRELQLGAKRINYRGDVSHLLRRESDAWTRERFDRAVLELARVSSVRAPRDTMARIGGFTLGAVLGIPLTGFEGV